MNRSPESLGLFFMILTVLILLNAGIIQGTSSDVFITNTLNSSNPDVRRLNQAGLRYFRSNQFDLAKDQFEAALKLSPDEPILLNNLSRTCFRLGQLKGENGEFSQALSLFENAIKYNPDIASYHTGAGWAYGKLEQDDQAINELETAIGLNPKESEAFQLLGEIYLKQDLPERAIEMYEKALSFRPDNDQLRNRILKIKQDHLLEAQFEKSASSHFIIKFEGEEKKEIAGVVSNYLEEAYHEIGGIFYEKSLNPVTVILYSDKSFREQLHSPNWVGGIYDGKIRIPIRGLSPDLNGLKRLLFHEYTHAVIFQVTPFPIPTWLNEGLAIYFEGGSRENRLTQRVQEARKTGTLVPLHELQGSFMEMNSDTSELAYGESKEAVQLLVDRYSVKGIRDLLEKYKGLNTFSSVFERVFLVSFDQFEAEYLRGTE